MPDLNASTSPAPSGTRAQHLSALNLRFRKTCQFCPYRPYTELTVPSSSHARLTVRCLIFTTLSHDQGWSGWKSDTDPYAGSNTFFDVRVIDAMGHDRTPPVRMQYNRTADGEPQKYTNVWASRTWKDDGHLQPSPGDPPGSNRPTEDMDAWLGAIQPGDTIQLLPQALHFHWVNFVHEASIDLWVEPLNVSASYVDRSLNPRHQVHEIPGYRPLKADLDEIRLAVIQPGAKDDALVISLEYTSLKSSSTPQYEALSYCWGDPTETGQVFISPVSDDKGSKVGQLLPVDISLNLIGALVVLRQVDTPRRIWVDLLCVNQSDLEERSLQVALMGAIYESAKAVRVWVGEMDESSTRDFAVMRSISCHYHREGGRDGSAQICDGAFEEPAKSHGVIKTDSFYEFNNDKIFLRPWFQRVWVVQEVWNNLRSTASGAAREVTVHCGDEQLPWETILQANWCFTTKFTIIENAILPRLWTMLFSVIRQETPARLACQPAGRLPILRVVTGGLDLRATDPRDNIFALLTFGQETYDISNLPDLVRPDYTKSVKKVFTDFTRWWILSHKSLDILSAVHALRGRTWLNRRAKSISPGVPQDIPDDRPSWSFWHEGHSEWVQSTLALSGSVSYNASADRHIDMQLLQDVSTNDQELALKGFRVGIIGALTYFPVRLAELGQAGITDAYLHIFDPAGIMGTWRNGKDGSLTNGMIDKDGNSISSGVDKDHFRRLLQTHCVSHDDDVTQESYELTCHGRCMFKTKCDYRVGLAPFQAREDDIIVILYGGKVPYVLRPQSTEGQYLFIGECYFEGFMNAEVLGEPGPEIAEEVFHLI